MNSNETLIAPARARGGRGGASRAQAEVGSLVLGRYELLERLGAGGFGVVWRSLDTLLDREVAVKVIPLPAGEDRERATREALAAARLAHPAIVALYEACAAEDAFYLISELVHGETLAQLIAKRALRDDEVMQIGLALTDALRHAHQRGVIHRDIKPQNVLVSLAGSAPLAKLTDFGGALLAGEDGLTRTGDVLGTLAYMAPEQIEGHEVDGQADLYSLALVLYEAFSGVNPVRGPTPAATARRIGCELIPLERHRRDLPRALTRALDRALDPEPPARGTLSELRAALGEHHDEPPDTSSWLTPPRLAWLAGALALCIWQLAGGRPGIALLPLCAVAPLVLLVRRPDPGWLAAAAAPVLGLAGLAAAFPALAGQAARWRTRALLGALGYWWLLLAELPFDGAGRGQLWLGPPAALGPLTSWEGSLSATASHGLAPLLGLPLLLGAALWALAAVLLPWLVRGSSALLDALAATLWAAALAAVTPLLVRGLPLAHAAGSGPGAAALPSPRGAVLGAALGAVLAVAARALRGPV